MNAEEKTLVMLEKANEAYGKAKNDNNQAATEEIEINQITPLKTLLANITVDVLKADAQKLNELSKS